MAVMEPKIGCVDVSEKLELRGMVVQETKVVTGGVSARMRRGMRWAVGAPC